MRFAWVKSISALMPPTSARAFLFALAMLAVATILRVAFGKLGATLYFATYFPAILLVALLAGPYAGAFSILGTLIIVWWAFLGALLTNEGRPYGLHRIFIRGDEVELPADTARHFALVAHEMITNAVKYGALKVPEGRLAIGWQRLGDALDMTWEETGGPPVVEPNAMGFGTKLLARCMQALGGTFEPRFRPEGLVCRFTFKLRD